MEFYVCPITKCIYLDPYITEDGFTYEKEAVEKWFLVNDLSPLTGLEIKNKKIYPNFHCKQLVNEYLRNNPEQKVNQYYNSISEQIGLINYQFNFIKDDYDKILQCKDRKSTRLNSSH